MSVSFANTVSLKNFRNGWMKRMIAGLLVAIFVPLAGPIFFCKCEGQLVTLSELKPPEECCASHCEPEPVETKGCCSDEATEPCDEEVKLAFVTPEQAGGQLDVSVPLPLDAVVPGESNPDLALLPTPDPRVSERDVHPPPGPGRIHLHFQILLI